MRRGATYRIRIGVETLESERLFPRFFYCLKPKKTLNLLSNIINQIQFK